MNEKLKDTTIDLLLDGVKTKIEDVKENYKWQELFVSTGSFCVNNPDTLTMFEQDLFLVFSKDNLKQMAKKLKDKRGYEFPQLLHRELYDLMVRYEIPAMEAETYIHHFIQVIINYLEENDPDKTLEIFLGDLKKEIEKYFFALESKLELVLNQIADLKEEKVLSYSITDIDIQIRRESKYKGMGLDFFKLDDEQFESRFQSVINDERIYVVGKSREETTYRLLNELRQKNSDRVTLIIKSEEEWNKLQKANVSGNILVPFFYAEKIVAIPNNTNIFVYGEDEPCYTRDKVVLRKRTKRNIINALEEIGIDYNEAYNIVDNTHGLYVPLKKKLFNGAMYSKPDWVEGHSDVVMTALLCGEWTEATGDVLVFEELSGKTYIECKKELETYLHRENPFVVTNTSYRGSNLQLASVEDAWEELDIYITDELWSKFILLFYEVLIESEPIFDYPFEKHFEASIYAEKPEWSPTLKKGMIRTLIMRAYYRGHEENQKQIDNIVSRVLDTITSIDKQCPHVVPQTKDEAWYLMPKAKPYKLNRKRNIYSKILEMLQLARIIQSIHERDKAHRDIKPENILVLNGKLVLSDFGLCWGIGEERLTGLNERVGPYKIMPPELERVQTDLDLDFKPSDVYLFSKVLWMTLKGDNIGFRGQYQRGEVQIYLNKEDYDNVITLEPIHKLMEEATFEEMGKRISIQKCIEYLELQRKILNREEYELLSNEFVSQLLYDEYSKKIIACSKPDELTYKDAAIITHMLRDIIPISNIFVKSLHSDQNIKQIQITDFQVGMDGICKLLYYNKGIKIKEYLLNISKMNYSNYSSVISLELNDISLVDEGYIAYSAAGHGFGNEYPRVYFSSGEKIIIKRKENL